MTKYKGVKKIDENKDKTLTIELNKIEPLDFIETYILFSSVITSLLFLLIIVTQ